MKHSTTKELVKIHFKIDKRILVHVTSVAKVTPVNISDSELDFRGITMNFNVTPVMHYSELMKL